VSPAAAAERGSLPGLIESAARRDATRVAIADGDHRLTYGELRDAMHRVAAALVRAGIAPGDRVGLLLPKSADAIAALLGAMRAGAAYVPVDPAAPMRRARAILADAGIAALVTTAAELRRRPGLLDGPQAPAPRLLLTAGPAPDMAPAPAHALDDLTGAEPGDVALPPLPTPDDLAYILYTSGTTGQPKGVMLSHLNALSFVEWAAREVGLRADDRLSSHAPLHFDLSVFDLYAAFAAGASVHLVPAALGYFPLPLAQWIASEGITVWYSVPSILGRMAEMSAFTTHATQLRAVLFAGEVFPLPGLRALQRQLPEADLLNLYGPTETNVCTFHRVDGPLAPDRRDPLPIGIACPYAELAIVDPEGRDVTPGTEGELRVRGASVMRGYWNDPGRTERALVAGPQNDGGRFYRTGDIVRRQPDGTLAFLGRRDSMVKVRGYRIELSDIEAALFEHEAVSDAAVLALPGADEQLRLLAAVVRRDGATLDDAALQRHCVERIPRYMVPEEIIWLPGLPRTSTGKIDRVALAESLRNPGTHARAPERHAR
jgi:amino acid adenylation domain-containing protein